MSKNEQILIQLTKAVRLLTEEGYNDKTLDPMRKIIKELREEMNVERVKTDTEEKVIYKAGYIKRPSEKEICICAAVICDDGEIIRGHRHGDCIRNMTERNKEIRKPSAHAQGFITSKNRFVDREEGMKLQNEAGIVSKWTGKPIKDLLFSEDLY